MARIPKTGDFMLDTNAGYYRQEREDAFESRRSMSDSLAVRTTWDADFQRWLRTQKVPEQYISKVAYYCYERGHANGEEAVLNVAIGVVEIFRESVAI
jgi:hypothetical protein